MFINGSHKVKSPMENLTLSPNNKNRSMDIDTDTKLIYIVPQGKNMGTNNKIKSTTYFFLLLEEADEFSCRPSSCIQKQHKVSRKQGGDRKKKTQSNNHQCQFIAKELQFLHCLLIKMWIILKVPSKTVSVNFAWMKILTESPVSL